MSQWILQSAGDLPAGNRHGCGPRHLRLLVNLSEFMNTLPIRQKLIDIAMRDEGQKETSRNRGPAIEKFWTATNYPDGYVNREPYCAAGVRALLS